MQLDRAVCELGGPEIRRRIQTQHFLHVGFREAWQILPYEVIHLLRSRNTRITEQRGIIVGPPNDDRDVGEPMFGHECGGRIRNEVSVHNRQPVVALILSYPRSMGDELCVQQLLHG